MAYDGILEPVYVVLNTDGAVANPQITLPVPPSSGGGEQTFRHATHGPCPFTAGQGMYVTCRGAGPALMLEVTLTVANMAGTQLLETVSGLITVTPGSPQKIDLAVTTAAIGTDLSYDGVAMKVTTTAGGVFMATFEVAARYAPQEG